MRCRWGLAEKKLGHGPAYPHSGGIHVRQFRMRGLQGQKLAKQIIVLLVSDFRSVLDVVSVIMVF